MKNNARELIGFVFIGMVAFIWGAFALVQCASAAETGITAGITRYVPFLESGQTPMMVLENFGLPNERTVFDWKQIQACADKKVYPMIEEWLWTQVRAQCRIALDAFAEGKRAAKESK